MKGSIYSGKRNNRGCFWLALVIISLLCSGFNAEAQQKAAFVVGIAFNRNYANTDMRFFYYAGHGYQVQPAEPIKTVTAAKRNGEVWNPDGIEMVFVEGGTFTMGCTLEQEDDCNRNEKPSHQVTVSDFYIGKYEVTQAQWKEVMGTTVREQRDKENTELPIRGEGDNYPMYYVSWDEAQEFIRRLNVKTGKQYRLPTEAEWEFAARGGSSSRGYKYSGGNTAGAVAWFSENSNESSHPVGTKSSNELGIYDMSGNVWEWCSDWYGNYNSSVKRASQ